MKAFALGLALKMRRKATRKSPFVLTHFKTTNQIQPRCHVKVWLISSHMIGFSDLVDLWVIKIKKTYDPLRIWYVETEHEIQITQREHAKGLFIL